MSRVVRRRLVRAGAIAALAAIALTGCGGIKNTITAAPGTADSITVALPTAPNANYIGIYEAEALGYYRQADLNVKLTTPSGPGPADQLPALESGAVDIALSSEPAVFAARNDSKPVVSVASIIRGPLEQVKVVKITRKVATGGAGLPAKKSKSSASKGGSGSSKSKTASRTRTTTTTLYQSSPDLTLLPTALRTTKGLPTYDGLVVAVMKGSIVDRTSLVRRFVQATARGYEAVRAHPNTAVDSLISAVPSLTNKRQLVQTAVKRALTSFFPAGKHPWGWQVTGDWNAFGAWMTNRKLIDTPNAVLDASTNELLAGQGV